MFKCQHCEKIVEARQPEHRVITETRDATYQVPKFRDGEPTGYFFSTTGHEIVKEIRVCPSCYTELTGENPLARRDTIPVSYAKGFNEKPVREKWKNPHQKKSLPPKKREVEIEKVERPPLKK